MVIHTIVITRRSATASRGGFTLIELLVVIAIIALLIGILLPAIGASRDVARQLVCATMQRNIGQFQAIYINDNREFFSSPNTSTIPYIVRDSDGRIDNDRTRPLLESDQTPTTPTSSRDWLSPILGDAVNLSPNRAERTSQLFNDWACAGTANIFNDSLHGLGSASDSGDFERIIHGGRGYRAVSFLMPSSIYSMSPLDIPDAARSGRFWPIMGDLVSGARIPRGYQPRADRIGVQVSGKVLFADGTRYFSIQQGLDFDVDAAPGQFGSFGANNPITEGSTAYGRRPFSSHLVLVPANMQASYRHRQGINVTFFDGHVEYMSQADSYTDPNPWYPSGSVWNGGSATPESRAFMEEQRGNRPQAVIY